MIYRNPVPGEMERYPQIKEGREFMSLLAGVGAIFLVLLAVSYLLSDWLAQQIPFPVEKAIFRSVAPSIVSDKELPADMLAAERSLRQLAARVESRMDMPEGMQITVHLVDTAAVNAGATLGGYVFVFSGLINKLDSEDALAAVLAHEFGHLKARHPIRMLGKRVALVAAISALGVKSSGINRWILGEGSELTALSFSRDAEREADRQALAAVQKLYGHVSGILEVFDLFLALEGQSVEILRTHPLSQHRHQDMVEQAGQLGYRITGKPRPLPPELAALRKR